MQSHFGSLVREDPGCRLLSNVLKMGIPHFISSSRYTLLYSLVPFEWPRKYEMTPEYKQEKVASVSHLSGGGIWEINHVTLVAPVRNTYSMVRCEC